LQLKDARLIQQLNTIYTIPDNVLMQDLEGEMVLLSLENGHYYGLDEIGATVWQQMMAGTTIEECIPSLLLEYEVDEPQLRDDLAALLNDLCKQGLVIDKSAT